MHTILLGPLCRRALSRRCWDWIGVFIYCHQAYLIVGRACSEKMRAPWSDFWTNTLVVCFLQSSSLVRPQFLIPFDFALSYLNYRSSFYDSSFACRSREALPHTAELTAFPSLYCEPCKFNRLYPPSSICSSCHYPNPSRCSFAEVYQPVEPNSTVHCHSAQRMFRTAHTNLL